FRGQGIDDPAMTLRFEATPRGFHAQVRSLGGGVTVGPVGGRGGHASPFKGDDAPGRGPFQGLVKGGAKGARAAARAPGLRWGQHLRTYRLAVACTHQYAAARGGTTASVLAAIVTTVNRVTGIYEQELAIRFQLVVNNDRLIFLD